MLKLRLQRRGKNKYATYRVVVAQGEAPIQGRFIADVGSYNPHTNAFTVQSEQVTRWLSQGAKPSATVHNLLVTHGIVKAEKVTIWHPPKSEAAPAPSAPEQPSEPATPATTPETPATPAT